MTLSFVQVGLAGSTINIVANPGCSRGGQIPEHPGVKFCNLIRLKILNWKTIKRTKFEIK